jgi:hypothetical protein
VRFFVLFVPFCGYQVLSMARFSDSDSWIFQGFPERDPDAILREHPGKKGSEEERQRAWWLWRQRPREKNVLFYGLLLGVGAIAHTPFLLLGSFQLFCVFHAGYILFVLWVIGIFFARELQYRRWKKDYLRTLARLAR